MSIRRVVDSICILVVTGALLWWVPSVSSLLYGPERSERLPLLLVLAALASMLVAVLLARRLPWWARGAVCAAGAMVVVLIWPRDLPSFEWVVAWSIYSGALFIAVVGGFLFGATFPVGAED